jgi:hypothetical protein
LQGCLVVVLLFSSKEEPLNLVFKVVRVTFISTAAFIVIIFLTYAACSVEGRIVIFGDRTSIAALAAA